MTVYKNMVKDVVPGDGANHRIPIQGGSRLWVRGSSTRNSLRLSFENTSETGWWVTKNDLGDLIAQLLYLREKMSEKRTTLEEAIMHGDNVIVDEPDF